MRLLGLAGLALAACSSSSAPSGPPATFSEIYPLIYPRQTRAQCNFCHSLPPNNTSNGLLSMGSEKATAYAALIGKTSASSHCSGKAYVVPGDPDHSLLLKKLTLPECGDRMPLGGDPLTPEQLEMIRSWIAAGAMND